MKVIESTDHQGVSLTFPVRIKFLLRHLIAMVYDTLLVLPVIMATVAAATAISVAMGDASSEHNFMATLHPQVVQVLAFASVVVFYASFWSKSGQSLGMQAWRLKLQRRDNGETVSWPQCIARCAAAALSAACLGAGYWWCLVDRQGCTWHDRLSNTELVLLPKSTKSKT